MNYGYALLTSPILEDTTTITIAQASGLPEHGALVIDRQSVNVFGSLDREYITYDGIERDPGNGYHAILKGVRRGAMGSSARSHDSGAMVEVMPVSLWPPGVEKRHPLRKELDTLV